MLQKIDSSLIDTVQWVVRQVELFTPVTRKALAIYTSKAILCSVIIFATALSFSTLITSSIGSYTYFMFFNVILCFCNWKELHPFLIKKQEQGILPQEIKTRERVRLYLLQVHLFFVPVIIFLSITTSKETVLSVFPDLASKNSPIDAVVNIALLMFIALISIAEYILCTISLPPGEKERRALEKETRNLIPVRN